jgi:hypothetical protein
MVRMRITRRFSHYNVGDLIAVELHQGHELAAKRLAAPLDVLVPTQPGADPTPQRQPGSVVRK